MAQIFFFFFTKKWLLDCCGEVPTEQCCREERFLQNRTFHFHCAGLVTGTMVGLASAASH